jgi:hypothetical protein
VVLAESKYEFETLRSEPMFRFIFALPIILAVACSSSDFSGQNLPKKPAVKAAPASSGASSGADASGGVSSSADASPTQSGQEGADTPSTESTAAAPVTKAVLAPLPAATATATATPKPEVCAAFVGRQTGAGNQGGADSPNQDCENKGGTPSAEKGGYIQSISRRYCMNPHSTNASYGQHGDCSNRGGKGKCGCWSCQADGVECYRP